MSNKNSQDSTDEACSSTTSNQRNRFKMKKPEGMRMQRSEFDIINEKLRAIHGPLVDLQPIRYEGKFLGRYRLYIGNLSPNANKEDLETLFKPYGEVNDIFIQPNKNFAFVKMDYFHNAFKAKHELNGTVLKDRKMYITISPTASILVKHLSPSVTNELLHIAFAVFGEIEYCYIITDKRGKSTGEGVVDFVKKISATTAKKYCSEHMFFITSSLKPVVVEEYISQADLDGMSEDSVRRTHAHYEEREMGPRFAMPGSFEYDYAKRFKELWETYRVKQEMLKADQESEERKLEIDLMRARYDHETERLKNMIRQREMEKERYCQKIEEDVRKNPSRVDDISKIEFKPPDNLFMQATQLNDLLDTEEREIQEQWRMAEYRSDYERTAYPQERYYDNQSNKNRRKVPEVIVHCQKRQRYS